MNIKTKKLYDLYMAVPPAKVCYSGLSEAYFWGRDFPNLTQIAPQKTEVAYGAWLAGVHTSNH